VRALLAIEFGKLLRLSSLRFSLVLLALFPAIWAFAPGVAEIYGFFVISAYQVPALALLTTMEFLLPLLVAIASAELLGLERTFGTISTVLLRPVTRSQFIAAKLIVATIYPFLLLAFMLAVGLISGFYFGYGSFLGGTGLGAGGLLGEGLTTPGAALSELLRGYLIAACSLVPISLLALLFTVVWMNAAGGALATLGVLITMQLMVVFPGLERFLLTAQLSAYVQPVADLGWVLALLAVYSSAFAATAVVLFDRKDF
jgi:ABC-2 type transport system permease protein